MQEREKETVVNSKKVAMNLGVNERGRSVSPRNCQPRRAIKRRKKNFCANEGEKENCLPREIHQECEARALVINQSGKIFLDRQKQ